jgi:histidine triad (HIT) family protein
MDNVNNMSTEEILELQKSNCIFCKIINKEIPTKEIYEDDRVMVILDINPANEGHCLILPKHHYQILPQIPDDLIGYMFLIAKRTSRSLLRSLGVKGTSIYVANGALAGQKAPHFMIHVIPRKPGDGLFTIPKGATDEKQLQEVRSRLLKILPNKTFTKDKVQAKKDQPAKDSDEKKEHKPIDFDKITELFK